MKSPSARTFPLRSQQKVNFSATPISNVNQKKDDTIAILKESHSVWMSVTKFPVTFRSFFQKGGITENLRPTLCNKEKTNKQSKNNNTQKLHINKIPFDLESTFLYLIYFLFRIPWVPLWIGFNMESFNLRIAYIFFKFIFNIFNFLISRVKWLSHFT